LSSPVHSNSIGHTGWIGEKALGIISFYFYFAHSNSLDHKGTGTGICEKKGLTHGAKLSQSAGETVCGPAAGPFTQLGIHFQFE
jgi:hypothetical protein